jgi:hypothetical protein
MGHIGRPPVLVDVGASGAPFPAWHALESHAIYVGFDPDLREMRTDDTRTYHRAVTLPYAIVAGPETGKVPFFLTQSPFCSSTLRPDRASLSHYLFAPLFDVGQVASVRATTLGAALAEAGVSQPDWIKCDSQGTDLRIFMGLAASSRDRVLALDIEPGLIDAYQGEDLFVDAHAELVRRGFWLSRLDVKGSVRVSASSVAALSAAGVGADTLARAVRTSPGWAEARYLRLPAWVLDHGGERQDVALLWLFAMVDGQPAFAVDVVAAYENAYGTDALSARMRRYAVAVIKRGRAPAWARQKAAGAVARARARMPRPRSHKGSP